MKKVVIAMMTLTLLLLLPACIGEGNQTGNKW